MAFQLQEIDPDSDFPELVRCILDAYEEPPQRFLHILLPINGPGPEAREAAIEEASERLKMWHTHDPSSYWQKVVDVESGKIVGGASWNIYETNPFADPHPMDVTWFPDDSSRKFAEMALENYARPRFEAAQRPHLCKCYTKNTRNRSTPSQAKASPFWVTDFVKRSLQCCDASRLSSQGHCTANDGLGYEESGRSGAGVLPGCNSTR